MSRPDDFRVPIYKKVNVRAGADQFDVVSASYSFRPWFEGQPPWKRVELPNLGAILGDQSAWPIFVELEDGTRVGPLTMAILRTAMDQDEAEKQHAP